MRFLFNKAACGMAGAMAVALLLASGPASAQPESGRPLPRFVSLRADVVNLRTGPGRRYPIEWVYTRAGLPIKIVAEYDGWRQVRTRDGTSGWVHKSLLSGKRTVIVAALEDRIYREPDKAAPVAAFVEPGVIASLQNCETGWCRITVDSHRVTGWMPQHALWGVGASEFSE